MVTFTSKSWFNTLIYLSTTLLTSFLGLSAALIMTRLLSPDEYGRIGVCISVLYLIVPIVSLAADGLVAVNRSTLSNGDYDQFRRTIVFLGVAMFLALQGVGVILFALGTLHDNLLLVLPIFALLRLASNIAATEYIVEERVLTYAFLTLFNSFLVLILTYALMTWLSASAESRLAALMVAELVILLVRYRGRMMLILRPTFDPKHCKQILLFGAPSLLALFGAWGLNESDKVLVAHGAGVYTAGIYTAAATLAAVMMGFIQALTNSLYPGLFRRLGEKQGNIRKLLIEYIFKFFILSAAFAGLLMLSYFLVGDLFLPSKYESVSVYFYGLVIASLAVAIFRPLGLIAEYLKLAQLRAIAIITGGISTIAVGSIGIKLSGNPLWAVVGIALGYLAASGIIFLYLCWMNKNEIS